MAIFIAWIVFIRSEQKTNLNHIKKLSEIKYDCNAVMHSENNKISVFNQYDLILFTIYADLDYLIEKSDGCKNNTGESRTKVG